MTYEPAVGDRAHVHAYPDMPDSQRDVVIVAITKATDWPILVRSERNGRSYYVNAYDCTPRA